MRMDGRLAEKRGFHQDAEHYVGLDAPYNTTGSVRRVEEGNTNAQGENACMGI